MHWRMGPLSQYSPFLTLSPPGELSVLPFAINLAALYVIPALFRGRRGEKAVMPTKEEK